MSHQCHCHSANRRLGLVFGRLAEVHDQVDDLVNRFADEWNDELASAVFGVGPDHRFHGAAAVRDLLYAVLGRATAREIRATWLEDVPLGEQAGALLRAGSIDDLAPASDSPLSGLLERRELETWFQPVVDRDGCVWGYECLMRARDDNGEPISPATIFEWARADNLLFMLDRVARETHIENAHRATTAEGARFLINFLPTVIYEPAFCLRTTFEALKATDLSPERFIFEVVETEEVQDNDRLREILDYYRANGFGVALDDIAAGYSGLTLLAELEPDLLKIDRRIVERADHSASHASICRSLIELAHQSGKSILAEGIETEAQHRFMRELGVDLFQGFLFGRPAPEPVLAIAAD